MNVEFQFPSVVLEHVDSVNSVTCPSSDKLVVVFGEKDFFQKAIDSWPKTDLTIVNNADGCGNTPEERASNQRLAFSMTSHTANVEKLTIEASGQMLTLNDPSIISQFTINFGHQASAEAASSATTTQASINPRGLADPFTKIGGGITSAAGDVKTAANSVSSHVDSAVTNAVSTAAAKASTVKSDVTSAVTNAVSTAAAEGSTVATDVKSAATDVKTFATEVMSKAVSGFTEGGTSTVSVSVGSQPTAMTNSPFGQADKIGTVDGLTIWCVDCGASGNVAIGGGVSADVDGITGGSLNFGALDFKIPLTFGFEASKSGIGQTLKSQLFEIPLTPFTVEPFFSIGPKFTFAVDFTVWVGTTGNLKAGANMHWGKASTTIQLPDKDKNTAGVKSMDGWDPDVEKVFDFSGGELNLNATLGIPMAFNVGLTLLQHPISKSVSITDTPSIELDTTFNLPNHARRDHPRDLTVRDNSCQNGIAELVNFKNAVDFDVFGFWSTKVASFSTSLYSTCVKTATSSSSASSSLSSSSSGPSSPGSSSSAPVAQPSVQLTSSGLSPAKSSIINTIESAANAPILSHATASGSPGNTGSLANPSNPTGTGWYPSNVSVGTAYPMSTQGVSGTDAALSSQGTSFSPTATGGFLSKAIEAISTGVKSLESLDISLGTSSTSTGSLYSSGVFSSTPTTTDVVKPTEVSSASTGLPVPSTGVYGVSTGVSTTASSAPTDVSVASAGVSSIATGGPDVPTPVSAASTRAPAASTGTSTVSGGVIGPLTIVTDASGPPTEISRAIPEPSPHPRREFHGLDRVAGEIEEWGAAGGST